MKYSIEVKDERLSVVREYMRGGKIQFFTEDYEKKLVEFEISPDMGEVSVGVLNFSDVSLTGEATADGKVAIARVISITGDMVIEDLTVGTVGENILIDNVDIYAGQTVKIKSVVIIHA